MPRGGSGVLFQPRAATAARPLSSRAERPGPDNIAPHSGALCSAGLRLPGRGVGSGRRAMRGPGGRQRLCQDTRERGVFGEPPPPLVLKVLPRKLLVPDVRLSGGKGPGGSLYAPPWGRMLLLGLAQAGRSLRRFSSAPGASPCDASRASCPPGRAGLPATSASEAESQVLAFGPSQVLPQAFSSERGGRRGASRTAPLSPSRLCGRRAGNRLVFGPRAGSRGDSPAGRRCRPRGRPSTPPGPLPPAPGAFRSDPSATSCSSHSPSPTWPLVLLPSLRDKPVSQSPEASGPGQQGLR